MSSTEQLFMWGYWKEDKGLTRALVDYFPETLANDIRLQQALASIRNAEAAIDQRMSELAELEPDEE